MPRLANCWPPSKSPRRQAVERTPAGPAVGRVALSAAALLAKPNPCVRFDQMPRPGEAAAGRSNRMPRADAAMPPGCVLPVSSVRRAAAGCRSGSTWRTAGISRTAAPVRGHAGTAKERAFRAAIVLHTTASDWAQRQIAGIRAGSGPGRRCRRRYRRLRL